MTTFKEEIYSTLFADSKLTGAGQLGLLLGYHVTTKPQCVFFHTPPVSPDVPLLTYFLNSQVGRWPRLIFVQITAWGDNFEAIQTRVHKLLHDKLFDVTDFEVLMFKWDMAGPELYDDDLKIYYRSDRYVAKVLQANVA